MIEQREDHGISIILADAEDALGLRFADLPEDVTLVRVPDPPESAWSDLDRVGFVRKPAWVTWVTGAGADEAAWLASLSATTRHHLRRAWRATASLDISCERPLPPVVLDEFLALYEPMVAGMRHGVGFAADLRASLVQDQSAFIVLARDADVLVGGCIGREDSSTGRVLLRFAAVSPAWRERNLFRVLYSRAITVARDFGYALVTAGNDPNLYGHIPEPGLLSFKARLGFTPVPAQPFGVSDWRDEADLIVSLRGLTAPALLLGYPRFTPRPDGNVRFDLHAFGPSPVTQGDYPWSFIGDVLFRQFDPCRPVRGSSSTRPCP